MVEKLGGVLGVLEKLVEEVYHFKDHYFEEHELEEAAAKCDKVPAKNTFFIIACSVVYRYPNSFFSDSDPDKTIGFFRNRVHNTDCLDCFSPKTVLWIRKFQFWARIRLYNRMISQ
jgi:hypothetical protein